MYPSLGLASLGLVLGPAWGLAIGPRINSNWWDQELCKNSELQGGMKNEAQ